MLRVLCNLSIQSNSWLRNGLTPPNIRPIFYFNSNFSSILINWILKLCYNILSFSVKISTKFMQIFLKSSKNYKEIFFLRLFYKTKIKFYILIWAQIKRMIWSTNIITVETYVSLKYPLIIDDLSSISKWFRAYGFYNELSSIFPSGVT